MGAYDQSILVLWQSGRSIDIDFNIGNNTNQAFIATILMDIWHWTLFYSYLYGRLIVSSQATF